MKLKSFAFIIINILYIIIHLIHFMIICYMDCKRLFQMQNLHGVFKPLSHRTALPQRLYSVLKPYQRAVGSPRNTPKTIKFVSYSVYTTSSQRPYSVHTTFPQRLYSVHDVFTARKQLLQRVHSAHAAFSRRAHSVLTAIIAFKIFN